MRHGERTSFWSTVGLVVCAAALCALFGSPASAKKPPKPPPGDDGPAYELIDLGDFGGGFSKAFAINEAGQVVGSAWNADDRGRPFLVTPEDTDGDGKPDRWFRDDDGDGRNDLMISLGLLGGNDYHRAGYAVDINAQGQVVGRSSFDDSAPGERVHAFLWEDLNGNGASDQGEMTDLGVFETGVYSTVDGINNDGLVVGRSGTDRAFLIVPEDTDGDGKPDLWAEDANGDGINDLMIDLGANFKPGGINDSGEIAGELQGGFLLVPEDTDGDGTPDRWWRDDDGDGLNDLLDELSPLGDGSVTGVEDLNALGQVAGSSMTGGKWNVMHAVRWSSGGTATDLGAPGGKWSVSWGVSLNDDGDVVGDGGNQGSETAVLWKDSKMYQLLDLLTNGEGIDSIHISDPGGDHPGGRRINSSGHIVGFTKQGGTVEAFVAVPTDG